MDRHIDIETITLINERANQARSLSSSPEGEYRFPALEAGLYTIKAELQGFHQFAQTQLDLKPNKPMRLDGILYVGLRREAVYLPPKKNGAEKTLPVLASPVRWLKNVFSNRNL